MKTRDVELHLTDNDLTKISEAIGSWEKLCAALGHLVTWNLMYPKVCVYHENGTDLAAVYHGEDGEQRYTIDAVWHGDHYGFHS